MVPNKLKTQGDKDRLFYKTLRIIGILNPQNSYSFFIEFTCKYLACNLLFAFGLHSSNATNILKTSDEKEGTFSINWTRKMFLQTFKVLSECYIHFQHSFPNPLEKLIYLNSVLSSFAFGEIFFDSVHWLDGNFRVPLI